MSVYETNFPIAQTFFVRVFDGVTQRPSLGVYLTKAVVFFSAKDTKGPVTVEIRTVDADTNNITNNILPRSKKTLLPSEINVSADASTGTTFQFDTPIYLMGEREYALIVKSDVPGYRIWTSQLGQKDIASSEPINQQPDSGVFFASSNGRVWEPYSDQDLKYQLYVAKFKHSSATAEFRNQKIEYVKNTTKASGFSARIGQNVEGASLLTLNLPIAGASQISNTNGYTNGSGTIYKIVDPVAGANGVIFAKDPYGTTPNQYVVGNVTLENKFQTANNVTLYIDGVASANTANIESIVTPTGKLRNYDTLQFSNLTGFGYTQIANSTGDFAKSDGYYDFETQKQSYRSQETGNFVFIQDLESIPVHKSVNLFSGITPQGSKMAFNAQFASSDTYNVGTLTNKDYKLNINVPNYFNTEDAWVRSYSTEKTGAIQTGGSVQVSGTLTRDTNPFHGPALDLRRTALLTTEYLINNDTTGEDGKVGGNALAKYISKIVTLAEGQDAEDLRVYVDAYKPLNTDVKVYYKILHREDADAFDDVNWVEMTQTTNVNTYSKLEKDNDFNEYEFNVPTAKLTGTNGEIEYTNSQSVLFTGYKKFQIKIVLLSSTSRLYPRVKNVRGIALQI